MIRHEQNGFVKFLTIILLLLKVCVAGSIPDCYLISCVDSDISRIWELIASTWITVWRDWTSQYQWAYWWAMFLSSSINLDLLISSLVNAWGFHIGEH